MKYPMINNWLTFHKINKQEYKVIDHLQEVQFTMDHSIVSFAQGLDGKTNPYRIDRALSRQYVNEMLSALYENDLLRTSNVLESSAGKYLYTLWIPKWNAFTRCIALIVNSLLLTLWFPLLIIGLMLFFNNFYRIDFNLMYIGNILGAVIGIVMHEIGHACAGISYGARVFEFGVGIQGILPCAYILMDCDKCKCMQRVQIYAAGVEMNFLITGLCLLLATCLPHIGGIFFMAGFSNALLGLINLMFVEGLDGMSIFLNLLGGNLENFVGNAKAIIHSKKKRKLLRNKGIVGYATIVTAYMVGLLQLGVLLVLIINIWEVISCLW